MKRKNKIAIFVVVLVALVVALPFIEDGLSCLAYYDHCTADRIEGLTNEECFQRDDAVAYLLE